MNSSDPGRDFSEEMFHFCEKFSRFFLRSTPFVYFVDLSLRPAKWEMGITCRLLSVWLSLLRSSSLTNFWNKMHQSWIFQFLSKKIHLPNISKYYFESDQIYALCMYVYMHACSYIHIYIHANIVTTTTTTPTFPRRSTSSSFPKKKDKMCWDTGRDCFSASVLFSTQHDMKDGEGGVGQPQVPYKS